MNLRQLRTRLSVSQSADAAGVSVCLDEKWEKFARQDPYRYILTSLAPSDTDEFWRSGERTVQRDFLPLLDLHRVPRLVCLEVGCGIGRLVLPLARSFQRAIGVDIAISMVARAASCAEDRGIANACYLVIRGPGDLLAQLQNHSGKCDFIYSLLVLQHVSDFATIQGYLGAIRHLLHPSGLAYLQFDSRPKSLSYRVKTALPDWLLPSLWRRGIRRIRRSADEIDAAIRTAGLEVVGELTPHTAYHRYILRRSPATAMSAL